MLVKTKGLVIRTVNYSDTSLIATIYTKELGLKSYMLRGARSNRGKKQGNIFQPMQFLDLVVQNRENKNLQYVREHHANIVFTNIPYNISKTAIGLFMLEVISTSVKEQEENAVLYEFIQESFQELDEKKENYVNFHLHFLIRFARHLGFQPMNNFSETNNRFALQDGLFVNAGDAYPSLLDKEDSSLLAGFLTSETQTISNKQRKRLLFLLERYYQFHLIDFRSFRTPFVFEEIFG